MIKDNSKEVSNKMSDALKARFEGYTAADRSKVAELAVTIRYSKKGSDGIESSLTEAADVLDRLKVFVNNGC